MEILTHPAILAGLIGGLILFKVHRYNAFKSASERFRSAILNELEGLYPTPKKWPSDEGQILNILRVKFPRLEIAVTDFRCYLTWLSRRRFDKAWRKYHEDYYQYVPYTTSGGYSFGKLVSPPIDTTKTYKETFRHNVDELLKYANQR